MLRPVTRSWQDLGNSQVLSIRSKSRPWVVMGSLKVMEPMTTRGEGVQTPDGVFVGGSVGIGVGLPVGVVVPGVLVAVGVLTPGTRRKMPPRGSEVPPPTQP